MGAIQKAVELIHHFEGFRAGAYICPAGKMTIGYGTTLIDGHPISLHQTIDEPAAYRLLLLDVQHRAQEILKLVHVPLNENNLAALISLVYNIGLEAFSTSTILKLINQHDFAGAALQFKRWVYGGHHDVLPGLVKRRQAERQLFCK